MPAASRAVMVLIFAAMSAALVVSSATPGRAAIGLAVVGLVLAAGLFLFEIHDPVDGFRLPWLQVRAAPAASMTPA